MQLIIFNTIIYLVICIFKLLVDESKPTRRQYKNNRLLLINCLLVNFIMVNFQNVVKFVFDNVKYTNMFT